MQISRSDWSDYIKKLSAVNKKAAAVMQRWMDENPTSSAEDIVAVAHAVAEHYGEAAGSLACTMYDAIAEAQSAAVPPAEPAPTATYGETAKAVYGTMKNQDNTVPATVGRLVKMVGADTMLQNARRDGAQFAWIPMGDTCAFCLTLASRGWQYQSKKAMKNGHAEHIHANCDCEYAVRFDTTSTVEGYDPDALLEKYNSFDGSPDEKINAWRREINANKRALEDGGVKKISLPGSQESGIVKSRVTLERITAISASSITEKVNSGEYSLRLTDQSYNKHIEGHRDYERYKNSRASKGLDPQSILTITQAEAQQIINDKSGTGIIKTRKDGSPMNIEEITCDKVIGKYWWRGEYHETNKAAIHHGSKGSHLVPQYGGHYD